ncbi:uncharacterized protein LOC127877577 [Dreissena polymorpha]|uniref:Uncharacterized protein n=1 Tax=Dreissena polymorpha TaxID=45954 RepID=A0A9D4HBG5_DREPO|nr:uncharacterized protein LOC127877577 [Dreissena polymorpha]XP_052279515.1 uncharacterized protein LOC127877577 [Dreissena polymorpha]KAH3830411.1 hypothetical protein DPMN_103654 [Dreissena polymorpha]
MVQQPSYTPTGGDVYSLSTSKQVLVTKDPVFVRKDIINGHYIGKKPGNYFVVCLILSIINPVFGPISLIFSVMSDRAYNRGDLRYAEKWAQYTMTACMFIFIFTVILYIAIGFSLSTIGMNEGYQFGA